MGSSILWLVVFLEHCVTSGWSCFRALCVVTDGGGSGEGQEGVGGEDIQKQQQHTHMI